MEQAVQVIAMAVTAGLVMGVFKGVEWVLRKKEAQSPPAQAALPMVSDEVTGKVTPGVCSSLRGECQKTLNAMAHKSETQTEQLVKVRESQVKMEAQMEGLPGSIELAVKKAAQEIIDRHEARFHEQSPPAPFQGYVKRNTGAGRG